MQAPAPSDLLRGEEVTCRFRIPNIVMTAGINSGIGFLSATLFHIIHPISAAIFGGTQAIMQSLLRPGVRELLKADDKVISKIIVFAITYLISAAISISVALSMGFPMHLTAALILSATMIPTSLIIDYFFHCFVNDKDSE